MRRVQAMVWGVCTMMSVVAATGSELPAPENINAADIGRGKALISWTGPANGGGADEARFRIERAPALPQGVLIAAAGERMLIDECGDGTFGYRLQAFDGGRESAWSPWAEVTVTSANVVEVKVHLLGSMPVHEGSHTEILRGVRIGDDGWAELRPRHDSRVVYVSSSLGHDRNDGLSEQSPKRTIAAGYRMLRNGSPDWLLLMSGDVFEEGELWWTKSGRSPGERMVVATYGGEARAVWRTGRESGIRGNPSEGQQNANLVFRDLHLQAHENDGTSSASGFQMLNGWQDVLIENCLIEGYRVNLLFQAYTQGVWQRNIAVRRSIIVDALSTNKAHAQGIFADGVDGLLMEENVLDRNGWGPETPTANMFRHNTYIQIVTEDGPGCRNVVSRGNISARASASGLMQRPGGVVEGNLLLQNPVGIVFGHRGGPETSGIVRGNVVIDGRDIAPGMSRGTGIWVSNVRDTTIEDNIVAHQRSGTGNITGINIDGRYAGLRVRNNILYDWIRGGRHEGPDGCTALSWHGGAQGDILIENNHIQQVRGGYVVGHYTDVNEEFTYRGNIYYTRSAEPSQMWRRTTYSQWVERSSEVESAFGRAGYVDPARTVDRYMESIGRTGGLKAFLDEARTQERGAWREEFTAAAVVRFVREGFHIEASARSESGVSGE